MTRTDELDGYAGLWLSELGAHVPEWHDQAHEPPPNRYGMDRSPRERARRHADRLEGEARRARTFRAATDPP